MTLKFLKNTVLLFVLVLISCGSGNKAEVGRQKTEEGSPKNEIGSKKEDEILNQVQDHNSIEVGANQTEKYLPLLKGKKVGIVANQTSEMTVLQRVPIDDHTMGSKKVTHHLVDYLNDYSNIQVTKVFAPEHGFRGQADAGEKVVDGIDSKTGLPILSLYGKNKKPSVEQLQDIDVMVFDIQDVGARFYTYISTLHYIMEACAENNIPLLIMDRPNPNGHYVDGPILEPEHKSFVGMHPVPVVHGMTIGEYAQMINGEKWLENGVQCDITVIPIKNYTHLTPYSLPVKPSPNLPNDVAINLYPSLCFFEGTNVSVGRGTDKQFQVIGNPILNQYPFEFTPQPNEGAKHPKYEGKTCFGKDLSNSKHLHALNLNWLLEFYKNSKELAPNDPFFNDFFTKLAGTKTLQQQIEAGLTEEEIKEIWKKGLDAFKILRKQYIIYEL